MIIIIIFIYSYTVSYSQEDPKMSYHINAWLENGEPKLEILDAHTKAVCMSWSYKARRGMTRKDKTEIQRLFRKLILLTCRQTVANCRVFETRSNLKQQE